MRRAPLFSTLPVLSLALACLVGIPATVDADWFENFNGGLQQNWNSGTPGGSNTFSFGSVDNRLVVTDTKTPNFGGATAGFGAVVGTTPASNPIFTDVRMTGIINPDHNELINDSLMMVLRANLLSQQFYAIEINYVESNLIIYQNDGADNPNLTSVEIPDLTWVDSLYVEIEAIGTSLHARVFDEPDGELRASAWATSDVFSSGLSGVMVVTNANPDFSILGIWDDVTSESIVGGDYNDDRVVNAADFTVWRDSVGMPGGSLPNDPTDPGAGDIGMAQYEVWKENFGGTASGLVAITATGAAVPEPVGSMLVLAALMGALAMRKS